MPESIDDVAAKLKAGLDPNAMEHGWSLLRGAAEHEQADVIRLLVSSGADPNLADSADGVTPLHQAVDVAIDGAIQTRAPSIDWSCVGLLLDLGADLARKDSNGNTPLDSVAQYGDKAQASFDQFMRTRSAK
ncbi:MAG: ankyrin repeat domain-containing protein [Fuerstiella sp.]